MLGYYGKLTGSLILICLGAMGLSMQTVKAEPIVLTCSQWTRQNHSFTVIIDKQARTVVDTCSLCSGAATVLRMDDTLVLYDVSSSDGTIWRTWLYPNGVYQTQHRTRDGVIIPTKSGSDGGRCTRGQNVY